jgi:hypothetical protein
VRLADAAVQGERCARGRDGTGRPGGVGYDDVFGGAFGQEEGLVA